MKKLTFRLTPLFAVLLTILFIPSGNVHAHSAGLALGNPTGFNGQYHINPQKVVDLTVGVEGAKGEVEGILNYYIKKMDHYFISAYNMDLLYGGGIKIKDGFGPHGSVQTAHAIKDQQLEVFGTVGGTVYAIGKDGMELDAYLGIRYLF